MNFETHSTHRQLIHDIRSPLSVLTVLMKELNTIPDEMRDLFSLAVNRINEIINEEQERVTRTVLPELVTSVVREKRYEYKTKPVSIELNIAPEIYLTPVSINISDFKRILSNLINNAVEAMEGDGTIRVSLASSPSTSSGSNDVHRLADCNHAIDPSTPRPFERTVIISIIDNGKGVPAEILPKLMNKGITFGKENGQGLGLYHAKKCIEEWGGTILIKSEESVGTMVEMQLI